MYSFKSVNACFELIFKACNNDDLNSGNPYNTSIGINVYADGFCGKSDWIIDYNDLRQFAIDLYKLYENLSGSLLLKDREYGSHIAVECDGCGHFKFSGKIVGTTFQELKFGFTVDQTYLKDFVNKLYNDFGK